MRYLLALLVLAVLAALLIASFFGRRAEQPRASPCEDLGPSRNRGEVTWWTDGDDFL